MEMNPVERMSALLGQEPIDRVPLSLFGMSCGLGWFCAKNVGDPIDSTYKEPEKSFQAQLETQEQYGYDWSLISGYGAYGTWEFGGEIKYPSSEFEHAPSSTRHPMASMEEIDKLKLPDVRKAGMLPYFMRFSELQEQAGLPITFPCGSPFTYAGNIPGVDMLCRWVIKEPELVHRLLRLTTDHILQVARHWVETFGPERLVAKEMLASEANTVISFKHFEKFALGYLHEVHEKVLAMGVKHLITHICGEQNRNLAHLAELPMGEPGIASFGHEVSLGKAIESFGDKCIIAGNMDPATLQEQPAEEIYALSGKCIREAKHAPRGYILAPGCDLSPVTPPENIHAMTKAIQDFGRYEA
jgi:uroporphyrinogen decarboxylase